MIQSNQMTLELKVPLTLSHGQKGLQTINSSATKILIIISLMIPGSDQACLPLTINGFLLSTASFQDETKNHANCSLWFLCFCIFAFVCFCNFIFLYFLFFCRGGIFRESETWPIIDFLHMRGKSPQYRTWEENGSMR